MFLQLCLVSKPFVSLVCPVQHSINNTINKSEFYLQLKVYTLLARVFLGQVTSTGKEVSFFSVNPLWGFYS